MVLFLVIPFLLYGLIKRLFFNGKLKSIVDKHVVITGGSSGIGKSTAMLAAKKGAHVTIIARDRGKLEKAKLEIENVRSNVDQKITAVSADASDPDIGKELLRLEKEIAPIYMLVCCTGMALCGKVEDFGVNDIKAMIETNYLSAVYAVQSIVPKFKQRQAGIIVLTASQVALMGMYGYSIYSSCKFALRGFAESIAMELKPYNVSITLALPPDTDTPGYEKENESKPEETKLISETAGLMQPEVVADKMLKDALGGRFFSVVGFESYILTTLCVGMSPFNSLLEVIGQFVTLGLLRVIGVFYLNSFHKIIQKCHKNKIKKD